MKIAIIGATGFVGKEILEEALNRGHTVTAVVRNPDKAPNKEGVVAKKGDIHHPDELAETLKGHDVVVSSVHFLDTDFQKLLTAVKKSGVPRYVVVGGAGSLEVAPGVQLVDVPDFPKEYYDEAKKGGEYLDLLKAEKDLNWTFVSPQAFFHDKGRTGKFRLGLEQLLVDPEGNSHISTQDYAIAFLDEIENPKHLRMRFTVGY